MSVRTDTECKNCIHKNVCAMLERPLNAVGEIEDSLKIDMNGLDIVISCINFEKSIPNPRTYRLMGEDTKDFLTRIHRGEDTRESDIKTTYE